MTMPLLVFLLSVFALPLNTGAPAHEFHLSRTVVRYVAETKEVQVEMHIFIDDLEKALKEAGVDNLALGSELESADAPRYLGTYMDQHFKLHWDGQELAYEMLGYEATEDMQALWIYFLATAEEAPQKLGITQSCLTEVFEDQRNLVQVDLGSKGKSNYLLSTGKTSEEQAF